MPIQIRKDGATAVVSLSGKLDGVTGPEYQKTMRELIETGSSRVVVDLGELNYISSAGLGELITTAKLLKQKDGQFCVANVHGAVLSVFEICRMGSLLKIYDSVADALATLP